MIRMDMTQMVRQAVDTAGPDVSVNRDKGDDRSGTDFLRMLRGRQQALDRRETEERLSKKGETRDKPGPADKKDNDAGEPVSGRIPLEAVKADTGGVLTVSYTHLTGRPGDYHQCQDEGCGGSAAAHC